MSEYIFYRHNALSSESMPPTRLKESEVRVYIAASNRNVERCMKTLKKGKSVRTPYATYTCKEV